MKYRQSCGILLVFLICLFQHQAFPSGEITVVSYIDSIVPDGGGLDEFTTTLFPDTDVGSQFNPYYLIYNTSNSTRHITGPVTIGSSPAISIIEQPVKTTIPPGEYAVLLVGFHPSAASFFSATIAIPTDAQGSEASYAFTVGGTGIIGRPPQPDTFVEGLVKKVKRDKVTGNLLVSGKITAGNGGTLDLNAANVDVYFGRNQFFGGTLFYLGSVTIKKLPIPNAKTGKIKLRKKSFKFSTGTPDPGYIFLAITPLDPPVRDRYINGNLTRLQLDAPL